MESVKKCDKKAAFTIVELLTVMSIIVILMGLVLPALNKVRIYAKDVKQQAQFHSIEIAMDLYHTEMDGYPESDFENSDPEDYCGAQKLCEAMMGMDLLGFHPDSQFKSDGEDTNGDELYSSPTNVLDMTDPDDQENLRSRKGPYLDLNNANAYKMSDIYGELNVGGFYKDNLVMCDVYSNVSNKGSTGKSKIGMPILYYKADISKLSHDPNNPPAVPNITHIYNYLDNDELVMLGAPFYGTATPSNHHPLHYELPVGKRFYEKTMDNRITSIQQFRPCRPDSYILISAGYDGLYGTEDDIYNFSN